MSNYVVQSGDTLSKIASKYGITYQSIASANGISAPYTIYAGQSLVIPTGSTTSATGGSVLDTTNLVDKIIGGILLYGIFRVLMKVF